MARCGTIEGVIAALRHPLDSERRASLAILVSARWFLVAAVVAQNYRPDSGPIAQTGINLLIAGMVLLQRLAASCAAAQPQYGIGLAVLLSIYDALAITAAIALADGFRSSAYILYYPALLAFSLVFPGRWGVLYAGATAIAYFGVCLVAQGNFHAGVALDQKEMLLRLATLGRDGVHRQPSSRVERERRGCRPSPRRRARAAQMLALGSGVPAPRRVA